jgi:hypothetical protein
VGRAIIESMRIDDAHHFFGIRLNVFTALVVIAGGIVYIVVSARLRPGREDPAVLRGHEAEPGTEPSDAPDGAAADEPAAGEGALAGSEPGDPPVDSST